MGKLHCMHGVANTTAGPVTGEIVRIQLRVWFVAAFFRSVLINMAENIGQYV